MRRKVIYTALLTLLLSFLMLAVAESNTYYRVKNGDNLSKISKKFKVPVRELRESNSLESDDLTVGKKLIIPVKNSSKAEKKIKHSDTGKSADTHKSDDTEQIAASDKQDTQQVKAESSAGTSIPVYEYHLVRKGDTPSRIAKKYGLSVRELKQLNNLANNKLKLGRRLIVGKSRGEDESTQDTASINVRPNVSEKIEEVKTLSQSDELSKLSATERLMLFAKKMLDLPYKFGGNGIFGLDCSSFVQKVYSFVGQPLPRSAREQYKVGEAVDKGELQSGDLLFFRTYASFPSHVGIYLGNNLFIHASSRAKKVQIDSLDTPYYVKRFIGAKRPLPEANAALSEVQAPDSITP
ncbi:MAG TPA: NlpC/P60 family protein [Dissulfurispiraceae bacterium]|nr:NlpC/P60 family protein [Dissulfurispiraceae bacterium]